MIQKLKAYWVTIVWVLIFAGWSTAIYLRGHHAGADEQLAKWGAERSANAEKLGSAIKRTLDAERALTDTLEKRDKDHQQELAHVKDNHDRFMDGVRTGTIRVSIPVRAPACRPTGDAGATPPAELEKTRAELEPEAAAALAGITLDGDTAIVDLNACIDRYNTVRAAAAALNHAQAQ